MDILRTVIESASCFVEIILCMYFFSAFKERRFSKPIIFFVACFSGCIYTLALWFFYMGNILFIVSVVVTFFMSLCYQFKWYLSIFLTVIFSVVSGISELIVMNLVTFTGVNFTIANSNFFVYIVGLLATKTFTYIIVLVIRKGNHKSFQSTKSMKFAQMLILSCVTLAISMIFCHYILFYNTSFVLNILSIISLFLLIVSNVMIFNIIDAQYELISIKEKL